MEDDAKRELAALQRERELLQAKEKESVDAIDEVCMYFLQTMYSPDPRSACTITGSSVALSLRRRKPQRNGWTIITAHIAFYSRVPRRNVVRVLMSRQFQ